MGLKRKVAGLAVVSCASFALAALCFAVGFDARAQKDEAAAPASTKVTQVAEGISGLDVETSSADVRVELYDGDAIEAELTAPNGSSGRL
jgi:hypothetical protein